MKWSDFIKTKEYQLLELNPEDVSNEARIDNGTVIGHEKIIEYLGCYKNTDLKFAAKIHYYKCMCDCGNPEPQVHKERDLKKCLWGDRGTISCGCARKENIKTIANTEREKKKIYDPQDPIRMVYRYIKNGCYVTSSNNYKFIGAKGLDMSPEWKNNPISFFDWSYKVAGYKDGAKLKRIDESRGYYPDNCYYKDCEHKSIAPFRFTNFGSTDFLS